jgi:23S rRNA (uracil1939-C5)-methyltransferase
MKKSFPNQTVTINNLDEQGYGHAKLDGYNYYILNALPGETVEAEIHNKKRKDYFGTAISITNPSTWRLEAKEDHYTSCSPWQILKYSEQVKTKIDLLKNAFDKQGLNIGTLNFLPASESDLWNYRNKVEYGFFTDKETEETSLSFFKRGSHFGKVVVKECCLIHKNLDLSAQKILGFVKSRKLGGFQLKTLLLRSSSTTGQVMATLFIKDETVKVNSAEIAHLLDSVLVGFKVAFSNPQSPASIVTQELASVGNLVLSEKVGDLNLEFGIDNFFQIHIPQFQECIKLIKTNLEKVLPETFPADKKILAADLYSGVGTIGLSLLPFFHKMKMVEISSLSRELTLRNAKNNNLDVSKLEIWEGATEKSLEAITNENVIIVDPPRSGLPAKVVDRLLEVNPEMIVYLSCNPFTQARDLVLILKQYKIAAQQAFDFYPQTPHMENLMILKRVAS